MCIRDRPPPAPFIAQNGQVRSTRSALLRKCAIGVAEARGGSIYVGVAVNTDACGTGALRAVRAHEGEVGDAAVGRVLDRTDPRVDRRAVHHHARERVVRGVEHRRSQRPGLAIVEPSVAGPVVNSHVEGSVVLTFCPGRDAQVGACAESARRAVEARGGVLAIRVRVAVNTDACGTGALRAVRAHEGKVGDAAVGRVLDRTDPRVGRRAVHPHAQERVVRGVEHRRTLRPELASGDRSVAGPVVHLHVKGSRVEGRRDAQ
eukprot:scaffold37616_cov54-Phaeocystis_antarctica.AAC.1